MIWISTKAKVSNPAGSQGEERIVRGRDQVLKGSRNQPGKEGRRVFQRTAGTTT